MERFFWNFQKIDDKIIDEVYVKWPESNGNLITLAEGTGSNAFSSA